MDTTYTLRLEANDLGQLLDGIRSRSDAWHNTAKYLESGYSSREDFIAEDCNDADEAQDIAAHYDQIVATIEAQMKAHRTMT